MRRRDQRKWNSGFTLVETLAAVAVLVILLGLGSVAAAYYRDYLRITELDNAAREIYMAAEHRAVLLSGSRRLGGLVEDGGAVLLSSAVAEDGADEARYVSSENLSEALLDAGSIDPALWDGHFYIVYEPVSGSVTDVFYAEEPIETLIGADFQTFYDEWTAASRMERMRARPMLGYYGGGMAEGDDSSRLPTPDVTVLIRNEEKLTAEVTFSVPTSVSAIPGLNMRREVELKYGGSPVSLLEGERLPTQKTTFRNGNTVTTCTWVLDSLESGEGQFRDLFGGTGTYGGDFTVSASLRLSAAGHRPSQASDSDTDNSLFAEGSGGSTAGIRFLRHLQNLDSGFSGVRGKTGAEQNDRIYCAENETYPGYEFRPIENSELNAYNGGEKEIYGLLVTPESAGGKPAGLFSSAGNRENIFGGKDAFSFRNIRLVNAAVDAGAAGVAGALAGTAEYVVFENCRVYWEATEEYPNLRELLGSDAEDGGYVYQIQGAVAGGLVGQLNYSYTGNTITDCFAATLAEGQDTAGGLLGAADGNLDIDNSYADCYLAGKNAAGLIGRLLENANISLTNCYAAGFIYAEEKAAGLCLGAGGKTNTENVYSAMCYPAAGGGGAAVYGLTEMQRDNIDYFVNTFYLKTSGQMSGGEAWGRDYADMTDRTKTFKDDMGGAFDWKTARDTRPYNLREHLNLVNYSFPGLAALPHYGDWGAQFQEPSLVYFEEYEVENPGEERYGFSGGNARYLTGIGKLDNERTILSDGYAVALLQSDLKDLPENGDIRITYWNADGRYWDGAAGSWTSGGGAASAVCRKSELITAVWENEEGSEADYYLIPLPEKMVIAGGASRHFFQYLKFELNADGLVPVGGEYFYNPHFAETVIPYVPEETEEGGAAPVWDAAAADRYADEELVEKGGRSTPSVRTPRHLYNLSVYREYYSNREHRYTFRQELHLDYGTYTGYGLFSGQKPFRQTPIGSWNEPFHGVYDGGCRRIRGVVFSVPENSERFYAGLFGYSTGTLRDIVYKMNPGQAVTVAMDNGSQSLYVGALAGGNAGTIQNCAVSGVSLTGYSFGSTIYVGGLVGQNSGVIRNSAAESASLSADCSSYASAYVGGLAGRNDAAREITVSYAVGKITAVVDKNSSARICGFVGYNAGVIRNSYAAADLESTGQQVETYGFCGVRSGSQTETYYLNEGNFTYREASYAADYQRDDDRAAGIKYAVLVGNPFSASASEMKPAEARDEDEPVESLFPYPTGVRNADNKPVHYGQWPALMDLGEMGVYYWEELEINGKSKFHISVLAVKPNERTVTKRSSLSGAHDDGGVVTNYGYGYYTKENVPLTNLTTTLYYSLDGGTGTQLTMDREPTEYESRVNEVLAEQSRGPEGQNEEFVFHSYRTFGLNQEGGLYPYGATADSPNATLTLTQGSGTGRLRILFTLNPLFADAMSVTLPSGWSAENGAPVTEEAAPGSENNVYGVRSVEQLQFINWNSTYRNTSTVIGSGTDVSRFPYLSNSAATGNYYWTQSHDIAGRENADGTKRYYTPIAEYYDVSTGSRGELNGWFRGTYDGDDYVIENVNIKGQRSSCAGLFGIVYNGTLKNIVLFSGEVVSYKNENGQTNSCWYAIGGLAGLAAADGKSAIQNCSVAGYRIDADVKMREGSGENWGGAEIGGLVGISFMDMEKCAAETTIALSGSIRSVDNIRMGGLAGASQKTISNSYAGGEIQIARLGNTANLGGGIYIGGLVGGSYFKPLQPSGGTKIGTEASDSQYNLNDTTNNALTNCYSYVVLPKADADGRGKIQSLYALGGTGEINSAASASASWDNKANHGVCTIGNCYYLESETLKNNQGGISGIKTDLSDAQTTSVTHRQLAGQDPVGGRTIYQRLNNFAGSDEAARENGPFRPVTTRIEGYDVAGKYSYPPGGRPELEGLDYPFPTILTRDGGVNCVHYGAWPLNGIRRDSGGAPIALDLYTKRTYSENLTLEGVPTGGQWSVESGDGAIASGTVTPAGRLEVTAVGEGTTKLTVKYTYGGVAYPLAVTVNVTAYLELRPSTAAVFPGGRVELAMTPWGRTPVTAAGGGEYLEQSPQGLRLASLGSSSGLIHAAVPGENESHVLLTTETSVPASEVPSMVSIGYTYIYKDTEQPHALAVTVLALPEAVWQDGTCTIDFSGGFGGHSVTVLSADLPEGSSVTADVKDNVITLEGVPANQNAPELTIALTLDGLEHTVVMTPVRPPAAGN